MQFSTNWATGTLNKYKYASSDENNLLSKYESGFTPIIIIITIIYGIYIALYPDAQSALQHFVGDFARLLI